MKKYYLGKEERDYYYLYPKNMDIEEGILAATIYMKRILLPLLIGGVFIYSFNLGKQSSAPLQKKRETERIDSIYKSKIDSLNDWRQNLLDSLNKSYQPRKGLDNILK